MPGLTALVLALMEASNWGWGSARTLVLLGAGVVLLAAFVMIELRARAPLVELRLFATPNFRGDTIVLFFAQFSLISLTIFGAIYTQDMLGFSPTEAGLGMLPITLPLLVAAPLAGRIYDRAGPRGIVTAGTVLGALGFALTAALLGEFEYGLLVPGYVLIGVGIGMVMSPTNTDAMSSAPIRLRGQASGTIQTVRQVGATLGIATLGTLVATVQNDRLRDLLLGLGESEARVERTEGILAEDPSARAEILQGVSRAESRTILEGARDSITDAIAAAFWVCGGVMLLASLAAFLILRRTRYADEPEAPATAPA